MSQYARPTTRPVPQRGFPPPNDPAKILPEPKWMRSDHEYPAP
jgi:hypothetical protein